MWLGHAVVDRDFSAPEAARVRMELWFGQDVADRPASQLKPHRPHKEMWSTDPHPELSTGRLARTRFRAGSVKCDKLCRTSLIRMSSYQFGMPR